MTRLIARIQKRVSAVPAVDKSLVLLLIIVAVALILRTWGTSFGLPFVYHPDEGIEVNRALQLGTGDFDFGTFRMLKGGYFYLLFVEFGFIFVILKLLGVVASTQDFAHLYLSNPTIFYLVGR
ncbi:MAG: hypothetical protein IPJ33_04230 [Gammaproteobacteria bacterium]|nr:hypothetical protein [Gammaproteobacteria bacterium]